MAKVPIPIDGEGFIRRACPNCDAEFKWLVTGDPALVTEAENRGYCCPYCAKWAQPDEWFTKAQVSYLEQAGVAAVADEVNEAFSGLNKPGGLLKYTPGERPPMPKELPPEPDDMQRVDFSCHPDDPLKIEPDWDKPVHCLICGSPA